MNKKIKKIIAGCVVIVVAGTGGYFGYKKYAASKSTATNSKFITTKVKKGNLDVSIQATGTISPVNQVNVNTNNTGIIQNLQVKQGDQIKEGALICKIYDPSAEEAVSTAENTLAQDEDQLSDLERSLDNLYIKAPIDGTVKSVFVSSGDDTTTAKAAYGSLAIIDVNDSLEVPVPFPASGGKIDQVYISPGATVKKGQNLFKLNGDDVQSSINEKKLAIQQAQTDLSYKQSILDKETITSPMNGIISNLTLKEGDSIDNTKLIATVFDPTQMQIVLPVDELDIAKIQVGQKATISVDAIKGQTYQGTVQSIDPSGTATNNVTTFNVTISISNPQNLKPGMNANVTIAVQSKENVLTIPTEALINRNGKQFVMVPSTGSTSNSNGSGTSQWNGNSQTGNNQGQENNKNSNGSRNNNNGQNSNGSGNSGSSNRRSNMNGNSSSSMGGRLVPVTVGLQNQTQAEIVDGLKEGDTVLIALPQTSSSSNNLRGGMGGAGGFGGTGFSRSASGGGKN